jgi:ATP-binding cassette, subfamily B, bacterial
MVNDIMNYRPTHLLWLYLTPLKGRVTLLLVLLLGSIGLQLLAPQLIRQFLDQAEAGVVLNVLVLTAVFYFAITVSQKGLALLSTYVGEDLGWAATNRLRVDLARHVVGLDMGFHKLKPPGELIERIDGDVNNLAQYFSQLVVQVLGNGLLVLGILLLLFRESWLAGGIGLLYAGLILLFLQVIQNHIVSLWRSISKSFADLFGFIEERLLGLEDIQANGGAAHTMSQLMEQLLQVRHLRIRAEVWGSATFIVGFLLYTAALVAVLALGAVRYQAGQMSIGTVFLLVLYVGLLEGPMNTIRRQIANMQQALASIGRINELLEVAPLVKGKPEDGGPKTEDGTVPEQPPSFVLRPPSVTAPTAATVQFSRVSFRYKDRPNGQDNLTANTLSEIDFTLESGRVLGVLGHTGSGKTTLTRLLFRLYDVDEGAIRLNGVDIRDLALSDLRQLVGLVTQDVQLFAASLRDNLTLFRSYHPTKPPIADETIIAELEGLGLGDWFHGLPYGLDTELGTGGQGLSAGESQLLAFTRVFLRDPRLVVLDEASSRLDPATEQRLERAIDRLLAGRTAIIIAHRLATVQRADDILIMENGRVVEYGPRLTLSHDPTSRFARLLRVGLEEVLA